MKQNEKNINLSHLKNIVSEERMWSYERIYEIMLSKCLEIINDTNSFEHKNRYLNWVHGDALLEVKSFGLTDIKEKYFSKRLIRTVIKNAKKTVKKRFKNRNIIITRKSE